MNQIKIVKPSVVEVKQEPGEVGIYRMIERASKTCRQINTMSEDSKAWMENNLIKKGHMRPLEFGTVFLATQNEKIAEFFENNVWSRVLHSREDWKEFLITTNYRVLFENNMTNLIAAYGNNNEQSAYHADRPCLLWDTGRDIADEFRTHGMISGLMESSRWCCYTKGRFDGVTFSDTTFGDIRWVDKLSMGYRKAALVYEDLISMGAPAEFARKVLPIGFRAHLIQCGFRDQWQSFFDQRAFDSTGKAHPDARNLALQGAELLNIGPF